MTESLKLLADSFADNSTKLKAAYFDSIGSIPRLSAFMLTRMGKNTDAPALNEAKKLVADADSCFDNLSTELNPLLSVLVSSEAAPEKRLGRIISAYGTLKEKYIPSPYLIVAASVLEQLCKSDEDFDDTVSRAKNIYETISDKHPFVTGYDDIGICILYALSEKDDSYALREMDLCEKCLKEKLGYNNAVQALTHVLAFYLHSQTACLRLLALKKSFDKIGLSMGKSYRLASLGALCVSNQSPEVLASKVYGVYKYLGTKKGFSLFSLSKKDRIMYATLLTAYDELISEYPPRPSHIWAFHAALLSLICANTTEDLSGITK